MTKVIVTGALGRMGRETLAALAKDSELDLAGGVAPHASEEYLDLPDGGGLIPISRDLESLINRSAQVMVLDSESGREAARVPVSKNVTLWAARTATATACTPAARASAATRSALSASRSTTATEQPRLVSRLTVVSPIPCPPPMTIIRLPCRPKCDSDMWLVSLDRCC